MVKKFPEDHQYMRIALALAERGVGVTAPNPSVGCVIVKNKRIIGQGVTGDGGRPHAETIALTQAGNEAEDATAYVTLEPCSHYGKTPPCAESLISAGIKRVVIAVGDPHHKVKGAGLTKLEVAGVMVDYGLFEDEAAAINQGFFLVQSHGRPYVTLKVASTMDGKIATCTSESQWITGNTARQYGHWLRAKNDAIMVGKNTIHHDRPILTCRLPGLENRSPVRIAVGDNIRIPDAIMKEVLPPLWLITSQSDVRGADKIIKVAREGGALNLDQAMKSLAKEGITRVLVEGGGKLAAHLLQHDLVDRIEWVQAPIILGNDGIPAIANMAIEELGNGKKFKRTYTRPLGSDLLTVLER